jgi:hypothetical protein
MLAGLPLTAAPIVAQATGQPPCDPTDSAADDRLDPNNAQSAPLVLATPRDRAVRVSGNGISTDDACAGTTQHMRMIGTALE